MTVLQLIEINKVIDQMESALTLAGVVTTKLSDEQRLDMFDFLMPVISQNIQFFEELESEYTT
jgi:hypothetical protein